MLEDILRRAKSLPLQDRLHLIRELLLTVDCEGEDLCHPLWHSELERRVAAFERGETDASPWEDVMKRLRQSLDSPGN